MSNFIDKNKPGSQQILTGLRRKILIAARPVPLHGQVVRAVLEDDYHHFRVRLSVQNDVIVDTRGEALRYPYSACPAAAARLTDLHGKPVCEIAQQVYRLTDAAWNCTHMLDLAGFAMAAHANGVSQRSYDILVTDRVENRYVATLARDCQPLLHWDMDGDTITTPGPFEGINIRAGFAGWALRELPVDLAEAALALRRGTVISIGRTRDLDSLDHADITGHCYSQQPSIAETATRKRGSTLDFGDRPDALCRSDAEWIRFDDAPALSL